MGRKKGPQPPRSEAQKAFDRIIKDSPVFQKRTFGLKFEDPEVVSRLSQRDLDWLAFYHDPKKGLGRPKHLERAAKATWPTYEKNWNPWMTEMVESVFRKENIVEIGTGKRKQRIITTVWTGSAAAGKTHCAALIALGYWMMDPAHTIVVLTSTSKEMLRRRVWNMIRQHYDSAMDLTTGERLQLPGHVIESKTAIQNTVADAKHAIFAIAVAHGETAKAVTAIRGMHARRMMLIVDEANWVPEAVMHVISNWRKGCDELHILIIGNAGLHADVHGRSCEPLHGWTSVSAETGSWQTKGVDEWQLPSGMCYHFDGFRSPNVLAKETKWPFLYQYEDYLNAISKAEYQRTSNYWSYDRGFWIGEGAADLVFTEAMMARCKVRETLPLISQPIPVAFLDPAFGGDECVFQLGDIAQVDGGKTVLTYRDETILNPFSDTTKDSEYNIAQQTIQLCKQHGIAPSFLGTDSAGTGRGVASIIAAEWSPAVLRMNQAERPDDLRATWSDKPERQEFDRAATANWFYLQALVMNQQVKGLKNETILQLCKRTFEGAGRYSKLETKENFKKRMGGKSPDRADAAVGLAWVAKQHGLTIDGVFSIPNEQETAPIEDAFDEDGSYLDPILAEETVELGW